MTDDKKTVRSSTSDAVQAAIAPYIKRALAAVAEVPFDHRGRRNWAAAPAQVAEVVKAGLAAKEVGSFVRDFAPRIGMSEGGYSYYLRGRNSSGGVWPELRGYLATAKVKYLGQEDEEHRAAQSQGPAKSESPSRRRPAEPIPPEADVKMAEQVTKSASERTAALVRTAREHYAGLLRTQAQALVADAAKMFNGKEVAPTSEAVEQAIGATKALDMARLRAEGLLHQAKVMQADADALCAAEGK